MNNVFLARSRLEDVRSSGSVDRRVDDAARFLEGALAELEQLNAWSRAGRRP